MQPAYPKANLLAEKKQSLANSGESRESSIKPVWRNGRRTGLKIVKLPI
jgi:hypothetical protein